MRIAIVVGTRPEITKMSPIIKACEKRSLDFAVINTRQHYSDNMSGSFFRELDLPSPHYTFDTTPGSHAQQLASLMINFEKLFTKDPFDIVLVQGDTNTVLAGALMASRQNIAVGHVEAGLRSHDRSMPEETNRIMTDHISRYLFAPSDEAVQTLLAEGIAEDTVWNTGNTVVDATLAGVELAMQRPQNRDIPEKYILVTLHRPANVDDPEVLQEIIHGITSVMQAHQLEVVFAVHPRTRKNIETANIRLPKGFHLIEPQAYLDFLRLQANAALIMTDSGGLQEEACILHVPCVTLRNNTERPETVNIGANVLGGTRAETIVEAADLMIKSPREWSIPYGDGTTSEHILDIISGNVSAGEAAAAKKVPELITL